VAGEVVQAPRQRLAPSFVAPGRLLPASRGGGCLVRRWCCYGGCHRKAGRVQRGVAAALCCGRRCKGLRRRKHAAAACVERRPGLLPRQAGGLHNVRNGPVACDLNAFSLAHVKTPGWGLSA
jgi:hypothetical protein